MPYAAHKAGTLLIPSGPQVEPGEHRFIRQPSYAAYRLAMVEPAAKLARMVDGWTYRPHDDLSEVLLERLRAGVLRSPFTPQHVSTFFRNAA